MESLVVHPTAEWSPLAEANYVKVDLGAMAWADLDLSLYVTRVSPAGGFLALALDTSKPHEEASRNTVRIFSASGSAVSIVAWESRERMAGFGWGEGEVLLVVLEDGSVRQYAAAGSMVGSFSLGEDVKRQRVAAVEVWGRGLVALTREHQFCSVERLDDPCPEMLANTGMDREPSSWTVMRPEFTGHGGVEVLVGTPDGSVLVVQADRCGDQQLSNGPFLRLAVSPNGLMVASFTAAGVIWVTRTDFTELSQFNAQRKLPPAQLVWCGSDAVMAYWESPSLALLVGPSGDWLKFTYEAQACLVPEVDGVRIISRRHEFLQRVPRVTEDIFKIASIAPSAKLYDAMEHFSRKSPRADDLIRSLLDAQTLADAVRACIEGALLEWDTTRQQALLQAASFGMCFLSDFERSLFVTSCRQLRVLNAVREARVGIYVSYPQLQQTGVDALVDRLVVRSEHFMAWKICNWLHVNGHRVLVHWACTKVKGAGDEEEITRSIVEKLAEVPGVSYAEIASTAFKHGRPKLATRLLDYEPRAQDQVPLLLSMHQTEMALLKAIQSGDTDLVHVVLSHLRRVHRKQPADFVAAIRDKPVALNLMIQYCWERDHDLLKLLFQAAGVPERQGDLLCHKAYQLQDMEGRARMLSAAIELYAGHRFEAQEVASQVLLLRTQMDLENSDPEEPYVGLSVRQTVRRLLEKGEEKKAQRLASDFHVQDRHFWWIKIRALVARKRFEALAEFSSKRSPIGFGPFVDACISAGAPDEAMRYIPNLPDLHVRANYYLQLERWREAADTAVALKDPDALQQILAKCKSPNDRAYIDSLLQQM